MLRAWYQEIKKHLGEKGLIDIDGSRISNCNESAFYLCPKGERIHVRKGDKAVYNSMSKVEKDCITVLFTTNAVSTLVLPMIVFPYDRIPYSIF